MSEIGEVPVNNYVIVPKNVIDSSTPPILEEFGGLLGRFSERFGRRVKKIQAG